MKTITPQFKPLAILIATLGATLANPVTITTGTIGNTAGAGTHYIEKCTGAGCTNFAALASVAATRTIRIQSRPLQVPTGPWRPASQAGARRRRTGRGRERRCPGSPGR